MGGFSKAYEPGNEKKLLPIWKESRIIRELVSVTTMKRRDVDEYSASDPILSCFGLVVSKWTNMSFSDAFLQIIAKKVLWRLDKGLVQLYLSFPRFLPTRQQISQNVVYPSSATNLSNAITYPEIDKSTKPSAFFLSLNVSWSWDFCVCWLYFWFI